MSAPAPAPSRLGRALPVLAALGLSIAWSTSSVPLHPLHPVALLWVVLLLSTVLTTPRAVAVTVAALAVRMLTPTTIALHVDKAYGAMLAASGTHPANPLYGDAWPTLASLTTVVGHVGPDAVQDLDRVLGALTCGALAVGVSRRGRPDAGVFAGLLLALAPLHRAGSATEVPSVLVGALHVTAALGVLRPGRASALLGASALVLLAHVRPEQGLLVATFGLWALLARRPWVAAAAVVAVLTRLWAWRAAPPTSRDLDLLFLGGWVDRDRMASWWGHDAAFVLLDPTRTPVMLTVLALFGLAVTWRARPAARGWVALMVVGTLLYATQPAAADRLRFQLPVQVAAAALAGLTLSGLRPRARRLAAVIAAVSLFWTPDPYPPYPWQTEHGVLRAALSQLPAGAVIRYDDTLDPQRNLATWAEAAGSGTSWRPLREGVAPTDWRFVDLAELRRGALPPDLSGRAPVVTATVGADWGGLGHYGPWDPVVTGKAIGLWSPASGQPHEQRDTDGQ